MSGTEVETIPDLYNYELPDVHCKSSFSLERSTILLQSSHRKQNLTALTPVKQSNTKGSSPELLHLTNLNSVKNENSMQGDSVVDDVIDLLDFEVEIEGDMGDDPLLTTDRINV